MKINVAIVFMVLCFAHQTLGDPCTRPAEILKFEAECFEEHGARTDKIYNKVHNYVLSAKKKLGFAVDTADSTERSPQKCEYYECILKKMDLINEHNLPDYSLTVTTIKKYSDEMDPTKCFDMLTDMLGMTRNGNGATSVLETHINDESDEIFVNGGGLTVLTHEENPLVVDHVIACQLATGLFRCMSKFPGSECSIFQYP